MCHECRQEGIGYNLWYVAGPSHTNGNTREIKIEREGIGPVCITAGCFMCVTECVRVPKPRGDIACFTEEN